eukprot:TRINITY_DN2917_c0_g2_i1.p1 TRINITY_DN2917_c0_g2~~TRINITY_DN2917_c0_g2_i1.p1  ORF type:complete len:620 (+),score=88.86 TRINITY_DN2917_c0_g2_i1:68-1861(+)
MQGVPMDEKDAERKKQLEHNSSVSFAEMLRQAHRTNNKLDFMFLSTDDPTKMEALDVQRAREENNPEPISNHNGGCFYVRLRFLLNRPTVVELADGSFVAWYLMKKKDQSYDKVRNLWQELNAKSEMRIYSRDGKVLRTLKLPKVAVMNVCQIDDSRLFVVTTDAKNFIWNLATEPPLKTSDGKVLITKKRRTDEDKDEDADQEVYTGETNAPSLSGFWSFAKRIDKWGKRFGGPMQQKIRLKYEKHQLEKPEHKQRRDAKRKERQNNQSSDTKDSDEDDPDELFEYSSEEEFLLLPKEVYQEYQEQKRLHEDELVWLGVGARSGRIAVLQIAKNTASDSAHSEVLISAREIHEDMMCMGETSDGRLVTANHNMAKVWGDDHGDPAERTFKFRLVTEELTSYQTRHVRLCNGNRLVTVHSRLWTSTCFNLWDVSTGAYLGCLYDSKDIQDDCWSIIALSNGCVAALVQTTVDGGNKGIFRIDVWDTTTKKLVDRWDCSAFNQRYLHRLVELHDGFLALISSPSSTSTTIYAKRIISRNQSLVNMCSYVVGEVIACRSKYFVDEGLVNRDLSQLSAVLPEELVNHCRQFVVAYQRQYP